MSAFVTSLTLLSMLVSLATFSPFFQEESTKPFGIKIEKFLRSNKNPPVLLFGSSLILLPLARLDDRIAGRKARYDKWFYYDYVNHCDSAIYLESELRKVTTRHIAIGNLSLSACMVSDYCLFLNKVLAKKKHPKLLICALAPRDFVDNICARTTKTPVEQALDTIEHLYIVKENNGSLKATASFAETLQLKLRHVREKAITCLRQMGKFLIPEKLPQSPIVRQELQDNDLGLADHPDYTPKPNTFRDLRIYRQRYNPPNLKLLKAELTSLDTLIQTADNNDISVILVNMPLTPQNKQLINPHLYKAYFDGIQRTGRRHHAPLLNLDRQDLFTTTDFEDSCHLNEQGGVKLFSRIASFVASVKAL